LGKIERIKAMRIVLSAALTFAVSTTLLAQNAPANSTGAAQSSAPATQTAGDSHSAAIAPGGIIPAELSKSLDAKKAKPGDRIEAKTTVDMLSHGQIMLPRNTKIVGHVTEAKAHSKDSPDSTLGIVFDQLLMKDGRQMPAKLMVQAIGKPLQQGAGSESMGGSPGMAPSAPQGGGSMGGPQASGNAGGPSMGNPSGASSQNPYPAGAGGPGEAGGNLPGGGTTVAPLGPSSQGAVGLRGVTLNSGGEGAVLTSSTQNVHLDGGAQLILRTQ
jgi:hypothetical protein